MSEATEQFKAGQQVYDIAGYRYYYSHIMPDGAHAVFEVVICQTANYSGDDFEEHEEEGQLKIVRDVFASAPKKKLDDEISALNDKLKLCKTQVLASQNEFNKLDRAILSHKAKLEARLSEFPHHDAVIRALNNESPAVSINSENLSVSTNIGWNTFSVNIKTGKIKTPKCWDDDFGETHNLLFYDMKEAQDYFKANSLNDYAGIAAHELKRLARDFRALDLDVPQKLTAAIKECFLALIEKESAARERQIAAYTSEIDKL